MEAKNGEEAYERVVEAVPSFELILTDIQMPICDGFEFTRKVRRRWLVSDTILLLFNTNPSNSYSNKHSIGSADGNGQGTNSQADYWYLCQ